MNKSPRPLTGLMRRIAIMMNVDPDGLALAPEGERVTLASEFILLVLVSAISGVAWAAFWAQFARPLVAVSFGLVASVFVFLLDRAIGSSDWSLGGILRSPGARYGREFWAKLAIRLLVTFILSFATSTGATMAMFSEAIATELDQLRREENQRIEDRYAGMLHDLLARHFGVQVAEIDSLTKTIAATTPALDAARRIAAEAAAKQQAARDDEAKELRGANNRAAGAGHRFFDAEDREKASGAELARAQAEIGIFEPRLREAQARLKVANAQLQAQQPTVQGEIDALEVEKKSHLVVGRQDAMLSYMALRKLYDDPVHGQAARDFARIMMAVLMTIELSYFTVRIIFSQASIYSKRCSATLWYCRGFRASVAGPSAMASIRRYISVASRSRGVSAGR